MARRRALGLSSSAPAAAAASSPLVAPASLGTTATEVAWTGRPTVDGAEGLSALVVAESTATGRTAQVVDVG